MSSNNINSAISDELRLANTKFTNLISDLEQYIQTNKSMLESNHKEPCKAFETLKIEVNNLHKVVDDLFVSINSHDTVKPGVLSRLQQIDTIVNNIQEQLSDLSETQQDIFENSAAIKNFENACVACRSSVNTKLETLDKLVLQFTDLQHFIKMDGQHRETQFKEIKDELHRRAVADNERIQKAEAEEKDRKDFTKNIKLTMWSQFGAILCVVIPLVWQGCEKKLEKHTETNPGAQYKNIAN